LKHEGHEDHEGKAAHRKANDSVLFFFVSFVFFVVKDLDLR